MDFKLKKETKRDLCFELESLFLSLIRWMHIKLLFVLKSIALKLMSLVLWMGDCLLFMTGIYEL